MRIIKSHTAETTKNPARIGAPLEVEFTEAEAEAKGEFDTLLDEGLSVIAAAQTVLLQMHPLERSARFAEYLSDDVLSFRDGLLVQA
jgi:hypothetical protein